MFSTSLNVRWFSIEMIKIFKRRKAWIWKILFASADTAVLIFPTDRANSGAIFRAQLHGWHLKQNISTYEFVEIQRCVLHQDGVLVIFERSFEFVDKMPLALPLKRF